MSAPWIPPRPARTQQQPAAPGMMDAPKIPPRPTHRGIERSRSPNRDNYPISPLNDISFVANLGGKGEGLYGNNGRNVSGSNLSLPQRPSTVSLPSIGQEGSEYANVYEKSEDAGVDPDLVQVEPEQTRNVGSDLPLHAPRPSFSTSTAKARVSAVTRTDSVQAAAVGIGKAATPPALADDKNPQNRGLNSRTSFSRTESSASTERPGSAQGGDSDHGIPEIGQRVPMYPDAGDVQAPSPSLFLQNAPSGVGVHNDGTHKPGRHHSRTRSGREVFRGPPGSYGMHGHGVPHNDHFGKAWYDKHPDALVKEESGQYGPGIGGGRGEWALSSEDLNKIVRETARRGSSLGILRTSSNVVGLPNEQVGYIASEEYTSRINSPTSATYHNKAHSNHSQTHMESPLRKASFPVDVEGQAAFDNSKEPNAPPRSQSEYALDSETEDDEIHVDFPATRTSKYSGNGYDPPTEDLGSHGGNTNAEGGWIEETGYGVPILASDEVAKEPGFEHLQPAVSPVQERRGGVYYAGVDSDAPLSYMSGYRNNSRSGSASNSRPSSRPGSIHGSLPGLSRFTSHDEREDMHTPLEDVNEYEPLFPEEEEDKEGRPISAIDRFKRREMMKRRFPSQDIWEDTPNSLQLQATVETPEPAEEHIAPKPKTAAPTFESLKTEAAGKRELNEEDKVKLAPGEEILAKSNLKHQFHEEMRRPGAKQRFPSRDIWEDSPDHAHLETTVAGPSDDEMRDHQDNVSNDDVAAHARSDEPEIADEKLQGGMRSQALEIEKPDGATRPIKANLLEDSNDLGNQALPSVPARPPRRLHQIPSADIPPRLSKLSIESSPTETKENLIPETRKPPVLPDRPKPKIPVRPAKSVARDSSEMAPLSKSVSAKSNASRESTDEIEALLPSPPASKPKPALPSKPVGGKIASLKAGFLSDLDKRLQLGPSGLKRQEKTHAEPEVEEEKAPLADARKSRARGPSRRKPAAPVTPIVDETAEKLDQEQKPECQKWSIQEPWTLWQTADDGSIKAVHAANFTPAGPQMEDATALESKNPTPIQTDAARGPVTKAPEEFVLATETPLVSDEAGLHGECPVLLDVDSTDVLPKEPLAGAPNDEKSDSPTSVSLFPVMTQTASDAISQAGETAITMSPGTQIEEKMTVYPSGVAQGDEHNLLVRE